MDFGKAVSQVVVVVTRAQGVPGLSKWSAPNPYCCVKGILNDNKLVHVLATSVRYGNTDPHWGVKATFQVPDHWIAFQLMGLRFLLFHSTDGTNPRHGRSGFLGGADLDLYDLYGLTSHQLELRNDGSHRRRKLGRLFVDVTVHHHHTHSSIPISVRMSQSAQSFTRTCELKVTVHRACRLRNADTGVVGQSDPFCLVRVVMVDGQVRQLHRTSTVWDCQNPVWDEFVDVSFLLPEQPVLLVFDVFDDDSQSVHLDLLKASPSKHLGTAVLPLAECNDDPVETETSSRATKKSKRELLLSGSSVLLETRLERNGAPPLKDPFASLVKVPPVALKGISLISLLCGRKSESSNKAGRPSLVVSTSVRRETRSMPFLDLVKRPVQVSGKEVAEEVVESPDWELSGLSPPQELLAWTHGSLDLWSGALSSVDRVAFVYGVVRTASGLPNRDAVGKSDPYCVVECDLQKGTKLFVHRTRVVWNSLFPEWREAFHFAVPADVEVKGLTFSIYDCDEIMGQTSFVSRRALSLASRRPSSPVSRSSPPSAVLSTPSEEDDKLGHAFLDLSHVRSGDWLCFELPVLSRFVQAEIARKHRRAAGLLFSLKPTLSVEVSVERRLRPRWVPHSTVQFEPLPRHCVSRFPFSRYEDVSQEAPPRPPERQRVLEQPRPPLLTPPPLAAVQTRPVSRPSARHLHAAAAESWAEAPEAPRAVHARSFDSDLSALRALTLRAQNLPGVPQELDLLRPLTPPRSGVKFCREVPDACVLWTKPSFEALGNRPRSSSAGGRTSMRPATTPASAAHAHRPAAIGAAARPRSAVL